MGCEVGAEDGETVGGLDGAEVVGAAVGAGVQVLHSFGHFSPTLAPKMLPVVHDATISSGGNR